MTNHDVRVADYRQYGTVQNPGRFEISWENFYREADRATHAVRARHQHEVNLTYGDHPAQLLDLYYPAAGTAAGIFVFLHGGAFREGHPQHYGYLAEPYLEAGFAYASVGYRLWPEVTFPQACADVIAALGWLHTHLAERGVDPGHLVLGGHSAGAILAATLGVQHDWQEPAQLPLDILKGLVLVSGRYSFSEQFVADQVLSAQELERASAQHQVDPTQPPPETVISYGPRERNVAGDVPGMFEVHATGLAQALALGGVTVTLVPQPGADHDETADALSRSDAPVTRKVLELLRSAQAKTK